MSTALTGKPLKDFFSRASVERLSGKLGDPDWLKEKRLEAWKVWEAGAADPALSGTRFLRRMGEVHSLELDPGEAVPLPASFKPSLESDWGSLSGCLSFGCEENLEPALDPALAPRGVVFCSLREALKGHGELVKKHLFSRTRVDETAWAALHAAYLSQGCFLYVPKGVKLEKPFRVLGAHTAGHAGFFPHTLAVLEEGAEATLVDELHSATPRAGLAAQVSELVLGAGAQLNYVHFQNLNLSSVQVLRQRTNLGRDSYLYTLELAAGSALSTSYLESLVDGEGGRVDLLGLVLAGKDQQIEIRTLQDHRGRAGSSDALVKSILREEARFYFDGVVKIHKTGQNTNAFQSNPNLLLSTRCKAETVPTLEIEADDVACKHAASIGSIDEEERFYLLSRGINESDTENMIVEGFAAELAQRLPNEGLQEKFVEILNRLSRRHAG